MTKQEIIQAINNLVKCVDKGKLQYTNRNKQEFERLLNVAQELNEMKSVCDMLAKDFTIVEIGLAAMDGTDDYMLDRILTYCRQLNGMIDELKLGA